MGHNHYIDFRNRGVLRYQPVLEKLLGANCGAAISANRLVKEEIVRRDLTPSELMDRSHLTSSWDTNRSYIFRQPTLREGLPSNFFQSFAEFCLAHFVFFQVFFYFHLAIIPLWTYYGILDSHDTTKLRILK